MILTGPSATIYNRGMGKLKKKFTAEQEWSYKHDFPFEEVCGTYHVLAKLIAPRLRCFKALDKHGNAPGFKGIAEWNNAIQKMTDAFELLEDTKALSDEENKKVAEGLTLFSKYFRNLRD
ncbi:hypothetical protein PRLR6025_28370 [Prevotella lacticifex]|nr:hypothetical protein PRLR6025_28370 [Prevotella lacticifex]